MIINVGARSDIVNYYSKWLLNRLNEGYAYSRNPLFKNNVSKLSLKLGFLQNIKGTLNYTKKLKEDVAYFFISGIQLIF